MAGKYYGVRLGDAIKFWWLDATFAVERRAGKLRRERRAAGMKNENEASNSASSNTGKNAGTDTSKEKKGIPLGKEKTEKESAEAIAASKMAPEEEPGAEKVTAADNEPVVGSIEVAAQQNGQKAVESFNIGGAQFDLNMGPVEKVEPTLFHKDSEGGQNNIFQQPVQIPNPQQMIPPQQPSIPMMQQPPIHRVDAPPKIIPPKPPRSEADHVEVSNTNVAQTFVDPNKQNKVVKDQHPDIIQKNTPTIVDTPSEAAYDNSALISAYPYLKDIENIALKHHIQLRMQMMGYANNLAIPTGIILCYAFNDNNTVFNEYKSFTIDTGMIIDRRPKLFKGIVISGFEYMQAYAVQINDKSNKSKNVFNTDLFEKIFVGGTTMLDDRGMYSPQYRKLNQVVDLSSMPTKLMNGERRKAIQDRLMRAMNCGVFNDALKKAPNSRFEFKDGSYNKERGTFILTNMMVPIGFNGSVINTVECEIRFAPKTVFVYLPNIDPDPEGNECSTEESMIVNATPNPEENNKDKKHTKNQQNEESNVEADASANICSDASKNA